MKQTSTKDISTNSKPKCKRAPGGGRKTAGPEKVKAYTVYLMPSHAEALKVHYGSLSLAINSPLLLRHPHTPNSNQSPRDTSL